MNASSSRIPLATKQDVRRDFVLGKGSIRTLAKRYKVANGTIQKWADGEKWTLLRDSFASQDELIECKRQSIQLNTAIAAAGHDAKKLLMLCKAKQIVMDIIFRLTLFPRCPVAKLEKPKSNELLRRIEESAERRAREDKRTSREPIPVEPAPEPG